MAKVKDEPFLRGNENDVNGLLGKREIGLTLGLDVEAMGEQSSPPIHCYFKSHNSKREHNVWKFVCIVSNQRNECRNYGQWYVVELKTECRRILKGPQKAPKDVILHFKPSDKMVTMHMILSRALCAVYPDKTIEMETRDFGGLLASKARFEME